MNTLLSNWSDTFTNLYNQARDKFFGQLSIEGGKQLLKSHRAAVEEFSKREVIKTGDKVPLFELVNYDGVLFNMGKELEKNYVILSFYRGAWCSFCNLEIAMLQNRLSEIRELGANIVAVSPQNPDYSILFKIRHNLPFPVLSDIGNIVAKQFGLEYTVTPEVCDVFQHEMGVDFSEYNADPSDILPIPGGLPILLTERV